MPVCAMSIATVDGNFLEVRPDIQDLSTCAYVVETRADSNAWRELGNMSIGDAQVISAYVAGVWAIAWGFKAIRKSIPNYEASND